MATGGEADMGLRAKHEDLPQLGEKCREMGLRADRRGLLYRDVISRAAGVLSRKTMGTPCDPLRKG